MMNTEKTIDVLNDLIIINNDRVEGYETATEETDEIDLKLLFTQLRLTSLKNREALIYEVEKLGGTPDEGTRVTGMFFRVWMDMKAALTNRRRKLILDSCVYGEEAIAEVYNEALTNDIECLTEAQQAMLYSQQLMLKADLDEVKATYTVAAQKV